MSYLNRVVRKILTEKFYSPSILDNFSVDTGKVVSYRVFFRESEIIDAFEPEFLRDVLEIDIEVNCYKKVSDSGGITDNIIDIIRELNKRGIIYLREYSLLDDIKKKIFIVVIVTQTLYTLLRNRALGGNNADIKQRSGWNKRDMNDIKWMRELLRSSKKRG